MCVTQKTMDLKPLARDERADLADFLDTLSPEQWDGPTLCGEWRVHELVAHLVSYDALSPRDMAGRFVKGRFTLNGANDIGVAEFSGRTNGELAALAREHIEPTGVMAWFGSVVALTGGLIHHQDIRRPLGMRREIPAERLVAALRGALTVPVFGGFWRARRLRLVATDLKWSRGSGAEVRGPAEAILMAIAGRPDAVGELSGPGQSLLAERVTR
jgi:uncharacterized protein (TIGR03083 family)